MKFHSSKRKRNKFNRNCYRKEPRWSQSASRRYRTWLFAILGVGLGAVISLFLMQNIEYPITSKMLTGAGIPFIVLFSFATMQWKNERFSCTPTSMGRYNDTLSFNKDSILYSFFNMRDGFGWSAFRYEYYIPYDLIERAVYFTNRDIIVIQTGGIITKYLIDNTVAQRTNYRTGKGYVNNCNMNVEIPLVYDDNDAFLNELSKIPGIHLHYSDELDISM